MEVTKAWSELRVVAEPGGAAAFAALLSGGYRPAPGERVAVLVCGEHDRGALRSVIPDHRRQVRQSLGRGWPARPRDW